MSLKVCIDFVLLNVCNNVTLRASCCRWLPQGAVETSEKLFMKNPSIEKLLTFQWESPQMCLIRWTSLSIFSLCKPHKSSTWVLNGKWKEKQEQQRKFSVFFVVYFPPYHSSGRLLTPSGFLFFSFFGRKEEMKNRLLGKRGGTREQVK